MDANDTPSSPLTRVVPLVLIVEDDPETRDLYNEVLAAVGFSVEEAHNGFQALEKVIASQPDLVLTDIAVPGLDGIELCRRIRADQRTCEVPVLAVTGYRNRDYPDRVLEAGADGVLMKPFNPEVLRAEARRLVRRTVHSDSPRP